MLGFPESGFKFGNPNVNVWISELETGLRKSSNRSLPTVHGLRRESAGLPWKYSQTHGSPLAGMAVVGSNRMASE
jgi:hypothetical protein